jgi:hypothetical protein
MEFLGIDIALANFFRQPLWEAPWAFDRHGRLDPAIHAAPIQ